MVHYQLKGKLFAGAGLGARILLHSVARLPDLDVTVTNRQDGNAGRAGGGGVEGEEGSVQYLL